MHEIDVGPRAPNGNQQFVSQIDPPAGERGAALWFLLKGDRLVVHPVDDGAEVPLGLNPLEFGLSTGPKSYLGYLEDEADGQLDCYAAELATDAELPVGWIADGLRQLYPQLGERIYAIAGRAVQIVNWQRTSRHCGQCGRQTVDLAHERAMHCQVCDLTIYPRLSPAIIIAVVRRQAGADRLLLARNHRFPAGRYSVIAGYVEPGETLEECARREVFEEVGIHIDHIRYFGSQPWPFPNSLMIGFTAEYAGGEISVEEKEIAEADWFPADSLPGLPPAISIARRLIDWFIESSLNRD